MPNRVPKIILVVEDDDSVRSVVRRMLERHGYTVLDAADGPQALYICSAFGAPPDLVITDIVMPEMTGRELVRQLSKAGHTPRVLLMSGHPKRGSREVVIDVTSPFIEKPFSLEELEQKVHEVLDA